MPSSYKHHPLLVLATFVAIVFVLFPVFWLGQSSQYNHFVDSSNQNKWESDYKLKKIDINNLPKYLIKNKSKYIEWFDI